MKIEGIKYICDRCGAEQFIEIAEDGTLLETPKISYISLRPEKLLCDDCKNEYDQMIDDFMKGIRR